MKAKKGRKKKIMTRTATKNHHAVHDKEIIMIIMDGSCASTHHSRNCTHRHNLCLPPPNIHHGLPRFVEMTVEKGKFELGFEVREGGEIPQASRQRIPDSWGNILN